MVEISVIALPLFMPDTVRLIEVYKRQQRLMHFNNFYCGVQCSVLVAIGRYYIVNGFFLYNIAYIIPAVHYSSFRLGALFPDQIEDAREHGI